jgi:hypothetical protein
MWDSQANRRQSRRYPVNVPASVKINTSVASFRLEINDATIIDIGYVGIGLSMVVETVADHDEVARMFTRHRTCEIRCKFPGSIRATALQGRMVWFQPRMTQRGFIVRFGVLLEGNDDEQMADLREFIKEMHKKELESEAIEPGEVLPAPLPPPE